MMGIVLQSARDKFFSNEVIDAILDPFLGSMGELWVGFVVLVVMAALYINSESVALPAVTAMLVGGLMIETAPPQVARIGFLIIFLGITLAGSYLWLRRSPTRR